MNTLLICGSLQLEFKWQGDRYAHEIQCRLADGSGGLLVSREGKPEDMWPASPALQSLHLEKGSDGNQTVMLVGMAGRSHWSMSVMEDATKNRLVFDVACRLHEAPPWLGSRYKSINRNGEVRKGSRFAVSALEDDVTQLGTVVVCDRDSGRIDISPPPVSGNFPQTVRWRYAISPAEVR